MRILIGNDTDDSLLHKKDVRAWTQRILWFAKDGDVIVLMCPPDKTFLRQVAALTGVDTSTLKFHVVPAGRFYQRMFDPLSLTDESFLYAIAKDLTDVSEIVALWASAQVSRFAEKLGLSDRWSGGAFFSQNGVEICNNKANFRAFASACGVPIPPGAVGLTADEARAATHHLLDTTEAVMVKKAHSGGGAGNQFVSRSPSLTADHAGARFNYQLQPGPDSVQAYWDDRLEWASAEGRFDVVIEQFVPDARSVYAEFSCSDRGIELGELGELIYEGGALAKELVPLRDLAEGPRTRLLDGGRKLAELYRHLGYRGPLSADALVTASGDVFFSEVNAQFTGSTHLYQVLAHQIVDTGRDPQRTVVQYTSPSSWSVPNLDLFLTVLGSLGIAYDAKTRKGVIAATPVIPSDTGGHVIFCIASESSEEREQMFDQLNAKFHRS